MEYKRYGKFQTKDYCASWIGISLLFVLGIACLSFDLFIFATIPIIYALIWISTIIIPNNEKFKIDGNNIIVIKGKSIKKIHIPDKIILVFSYIDICPPLARRTAIGNETHILKDKYAVTVLSQLSLDAVVKRLHANYIQRYTTSTIKASIDEFYYIYSFVCNEKVFKELIENRETQIILPGSLAQSVSYLPQDVEVYKDIDC